MELNDLMESLSVWTKNEPYPKPLFIAFNLAVTTWHMTDWLWMSRLQTRTLLAKLYHVGHNETASGIGRGLEKFQDAIARQSRPLYRHCASIAKLAQRHRRSRLRAPAASAAKAECLGGLKVDHEFEFGR